MTPINDSMQPTITAEMLIREVVEAHPDTVRVFAKHGLGCVSCSVANVDTVAHGAARHKMPVAPLLADLNLILRDPAAFPAVNTGGLRNINFGENQPDARIKRIIAVVSGKGGVGKSFVSSMLAIGLNRQGFRVGILDADITGPSIPRTFGIQARPAQGESGKIIPVISAQGIKIISSLFFVGNEDDALIWRGPLIAKMIKNFYLDTLWGELDYLIVDLPPGTSDAPLTVLQSLPVNGILLVSSPQMLATSIVKKAIKLAEKMHTPTVGVIENLSYLVLPDTGKRMKIFGESLGDELAQAAHAPLLARLPLDPQAAELVDNGRLEEYHSSETDALVGNFLVDSVPQLRSQTLVINAG